MLNLYLPADQCIAQNGKTDEDTIAKAVWIDLLMPTPEEEKRVESVLHIDAPTREEMQEIEISNRLYTENGAIYMTATVLSQNADGNMLASPVTFILLKEKLITVRYAEPTLFPHFIARARRPGSNLTSGPLIVLGLFEALVNRLADMLEQAGADIDTMSRDIFGYGPQGGGTRDFQAILRRLGYTGDLSSKVRESLVSLARVAHFLLETIDFSHLGYARDMNNRIKALEKDTTSLLDHAGYLAAKVGFLLDATLGLISIEQNNIFRIFSIVTVSLMPPTLIGAIYGMNFAEIPELHWGFGYPFALILMVASAIVPLVFFRRRGWL